MNDEDDDEIVPSGKTRTGENVFSYFSIFMLHLLFSGFSSVVHCKVRGERWSWIVKDEVSNCEGFLKFHFAGSGSC